MAKKQLPAIEPRASLRQAPATAMIRAEASTPPGEVEAGDVLRIDFTQQQVTRAGLYLVHLGAWIGVRRFMDAVCGSWALEEDGWQPVPDSVRVLGYVSEVRKSCPRALDGREASHG